MQLLQYFYSVAICILLYFLVQHLYFQSILKELSGDSDHVDNANHIERFVVGELIGCIGLNTENLCNIIHGVCPA